MNDNKNEVINIVIEYAKNNELANITVSEIADISTISRRTIYRYFEKRNFLLFEVYKTCIFELNDIILDLRRDNCTDDHFENLLVGLNAMIDAFMDNPHYVKIIVECDSILKSEPKLREEFQKVVANMDYIIGLFEIAKENGVLRDDFDSDQVAFLIYDTFLGLVYRHLITYDKYDDRLERENVYKIVDVFWNTLQTYKA